MLWERKNEYIGGFIVKKGVLIALVLLVVTSTGAFAFGIGGVFTSPIPGLDGIGGTNAMLSLKLDEVPFYIGVGFAVGGDNFAFSGTLDYLFVRQQLINFINYYAGVGAYVGIGNEVEAGLRIPLALYIFPIDILEVFLEVSPTVGLGIDPIQFPVWGVQAGVGFRFWF